MTDGAGRLYSSRKCEAERRQGRRLAKSSKKPVAARRAADKARRSAARAATTRKSRQLKLAPAALTPDMAAFLPNREKKLGFVPNVLKAFAFDMTKLSAFLAMTMI